LKRPPTHFLDLGDVLQGRLLHAGLKKPTISRPQLFLKIVGGPITAKVCLKNRRKNGWDCFSWKCHINFLRRLRGLKRLPAHFLDMGEHFTSEVASCRPQENIDLTAIIIPQNSRRGYLNAK